MREKEIESLREIETEIERRGGQEVKTKSVASFFLVDISVASLNDASIQNLGDLNAWTTFWSVRINEFDHEYDRHQSTGLDD